MSDSPEIIATDDEVAVLQVEGEQTVAFAEEPRDVQVIVTDEDVVVLQIEDDPFVTSAGEQGPPGPAGAPGAGSSDYIVSRSNSDVVSLPKCTCVHQTSGGSIQRAGAMSGTTKDVFGFVYDASIGVAAVGQVQIDGVFTALESEWDAVLGTSGGLVQDADYFLDVTTGRITTTPPSADGHYVCRVGTAVSPQKLQIRVEPTIKL